MLPGAEDPGGSPAEAPRTHHLFWTYLTSSIPSKSESCVHSAASCTRAVARITLSAMGSPESIEILAARRARDASPGPLPIPAASPRPPGAPHLRRVAGARARTPRVVGADRGNDQRRYVLDPRGEEIRVRAVGEVLQPSGGIDDVRTRSGARPTSVSMPFRRPRASRRGRKGTNSIRPSYRIT